MAHLVFKCVAFKPLTEARSPSSVDVNFIIITMNNVTEKLRRAETKYLTVDSYINSISGFNSNSFDTWIKFFE